MPSNVIIFDAEYIAEVTSNMNMACSLVGEAVKALKKASLHEGWQCRECVTISDNLDDLNSRLGRLDQGVNETTRILRGSVSRFEELERKYRDQTENLSRDLQSNYGFTGSGYSGSSEQPGTNLGGVAAGGGVSAPAVTAGQNTSGTPNGSAPSAPNAQSGGSQVMPNTGKNPATSMSTPVSPTGIAGGQQGNTNMPNTSNTQTQYTVSQAAPSWSISSGGEVQLPVTHIPYRPEAAATGVKAVAEAEYTAVGGVTESVMAVLGSTDISSLTPEQQNILADGITQAYTTGREIVNNTTRIITEPAKPHTQENVAIASGLANLFGGLSKTFSALGLPGLSVMGGSDPAGDVSAATASGGQVSGGSFMSGTHFASSGLATNAESIIQNIGNDSDSQEVKDMLQTFTSKGSGAGSGSTGNTFLDKIKSSIMEKLQGDVSLGFFGSVGIQDFLGKVS